MKRALVAGVAVASLALPGAAVAAAPTPTDQKNAAKECKALRGSDQASQEAFAAQYRNFGACVSQKAREEAAERRAAKSKAKSQCRTELSELGRQAFNEKYGTNRNKRNAYGKCVSQNAKKNKAKADQQDAKQAQAQKNAAKQCKAERDGMGEQAFNEKYGTNRNKSNAFGKCVSATARS